MPQAGTRTAVSVAGVFVTVGTSVSVAVGNGNIVCTVAVAVICASGKVVGRKSRGKLSCCAMSNAMNNVAIVPRIARIVTRQLFSLVDEFMLQFLVRGVLQIVRWCAAER